MSQLYLELPISYYPGKLVLNDNLKTFLSGIPIPRTVNRSNLILRTSRGFVQSYKTVVRLKFDMFACI